MHSRQRGSNSWLCNRTWWRHHAHLGSLAIYVARQHGTIVGIAPLYQRKTRRFGVLTLDTLLFIGRGGNTTPDDLDFVVQAENAAQISAQLLDAILTKKNLQRLYLQDLPAHSVNLTSLRQLSDTLAQTHHLTRYISETPAISRPVALLADDWPTFLDDDIIGVEYGFSHNTQVSLFQTGFSPAHSQLAPGHLMMCRLISLAIEAGMTEVDLLKGDYEYKQSYADTSRFHCDVDIVLSPLPSLLLTVKRYVDSLRSNISVDNNHTADSVNNTSMRRSG